MQQQDARAGTPITDETIFMISTKAMLVSQRFPTTNEKWEELGKSAQTCGKWKGIYKKVDNQAMIKHQAAGGCDQFGVSVLGAGAGGAVAPGRGITIDELEGCFDSLDTAATTRKITMDELVKANSTLILSIAELTTTNNRLTKEVASLSQEANKYKKGGQDKNGRRVNPAKYCPNCKQETCHYPYD